MAIFHLHASTISRSSGRSSTAASAYRAAVEIVDVRTGEVHDYTRKRGVLHSELLLPAGRIEDRATFWNRLELHHKRGDAVVAREIEVSLPAELPALDRQRLAVGYARELSERYGVAADIALHAPRPISDRDLARQPGQHWVIDPETGQRSNGNWHAHILMSACYVDAAGALGKKAVELDPIHCQRHKLANMVDQERERWAALVNGALDRAGERDRVTHLSHAARGLQFEPTPHLGPAASGLERRTGEKSRVREEHERDFSERLARAQELGALDRELQWLDAAILDVTADIEAAKAQRELERQKQEQLRQQAEKAYAQWKESGAAGFAQQFERWKAEQEQKQKVEQDQAAEQAHKPHRGMGR